MTPGKEPAQPTMEAEPDEVYIEYMRLDGIRRDPENPKDHDLGALGQSFKRFGYVLPMAVNENTGLLMAGHGRLDQLEAMRIGGAEPPARIKTDDRDGMWLAPVIRGIRMSPDDGKAYVVADNRLVELGGWNEPMLVARLIEIAGGNPRLLAGTGFDERDVQAMLDLLAGPGEFPLRSEDDPETDAEALASRPLACPACGAGFTLSEALSAAAGRGAAGA